MSYPFTGKIKSAKFADAPTNSVIEGLYYTEDSTLEAIYLNIDFSNKDFLAFIEEYPLEKIEKAAKAAAKARYNAKKAYDQNILDEFFKVNPVSIQEKIIEIEKRIDILTFIEENNTNKNMVFDLKLKILDEMTGTKNKQLSLKIRKIKTLKNLLGTYYGSV
tara:strand:+ start:1352 stop:1837 length:486 start_codon:yes stop_codon:yes gene_type:complete